MILNGHEQTGATPKTTLHLEVPIIAIAASLHRDTRIVQVCFDLC
jgi:hypothetical protein